MSALRLSGHTKEESDRKVRSLSVCLSWQTNSRAKRVYSHITFHVAGNLGAGITPRLTAVLIEEVLRSVNGAQANRRGCH